MGNFESGNLHTTWNWKWEIGNLNESFLEKKNKEKKEERKIKVYDKVSETLNKMNTLGRKFFIDWVDV